MLILNENLRENRRLSKQIVIDYCVYWLSKQNFVSTAKKMGLNPVQKNLSSVPEWSGAKILSQGDIKDIYNVKYYIIHNDENLRLV